MFVRFLSVEFPCTHFCSTATSEVVRKHVKVLLGELKTCSQDFEVRNFDRHPFLKEHVISVAVCDTEFLPKGTKVRIFRVIT